MQPRNLNKIFNKFAGKQVPMHEAFDSSGRTVHVSILDQSHPVLEGMRKAAADEGLELRVWYPGMRGTKDMRLDRVNAHIEKAADGKWRVTSKFHFG